MTTVLQPFGGYSICGCRYPSLMRIDKHQSCSTQLRSQKWILLDHFSSAASTDEEGKKLDMDPPWRNRILQNCATNGSHNGSKSTIVRRKSSSLVDFLRSSASRERFQQSGSKEINGGEHSVCNSSNIPTLSRTIKPLEDDEGVRNRSPVKRVGSLTSSPKWSRIKRTFERENSNDDIRTNDPLEKILSKSSNSLAIPRRCLVEKELSCEKGSLMKSASLPSCGVLQLHYTQNNTFVQQSILKPSNLAEDRKITTENTNSSVVKPSSFVTRSQSLKQSDLQDAIKNEALVRHEGQKSIVSAKRQANALFENKVTSQFEQVTNCSYKNKATLKVETGISSGNNVVDSTRKLYMETECAAFVKNASTSMVKSAVSVGVKDFRKSCNTNIPVASRQVSGQKEIIPYKNLQQKYANQSSLPQIRIDESLHSCKSGWKQLPSGSWIKVHEQNDRVAEVASPHSIASKVALLAQKFDNLCTTTNSIVNQENRASENDDLLTTNRLRKSNRQKNSPLLQNGNLEMPNLKEKFTSNGELDKKCKNAEENIVCKKTSTDECKEGTIFSSNGQNKSGHKISLVQQVVQNFEEHCQLNISDNEFVFHFEKGSKSSNESWCSLQSRIPPKVSKKTSCNKFRQNVETAKKASVTEKMSFIHEQLKRPVPSSRKPQLPASVFAKRRQGIISDGGEDLANQIAGDDLISTMEDWLDEKCDDGSLSVKPNSSFLWQHVGPRLSSESASSEPESYYSIPFQHLQKFQQEEHIYMDATLLRNSPAMERKSSSIHSSDNHGSSCESDEGWVDMSDAEIDLSCSDLLKSSKYVGVQFRPRSTSSKTDSSRRSWSQSLRDLASAVDTDTEEWDTNDYQDISVWEGGDTSSSSTNSDHIYEALYDVILEDREQDLNECNESENCDRPNSGDTGIESGPASSTPSAHLSENKDENVIEEKLEDAKTEGLKRNWSLTKSDIRLELSSKLNKIKIRKNFRSTTDIGVGVQVQQPTSPLPETKKKTLIKFILRQKSSTAVPTVQKKRNKKGATFYVRWSVVDKNTRGRSQSESALVEATKTDGSVFHRQMSEGASLISVQDESNSAAATKRPSLISVPVQDEPKHKATVKRRPSGAGAIKRPTSPPPLPPVSAGVNLMRKGTKSLELVTTRSAISRSDSNKSRSLDVDKVAAFDYCEGKQPLNMGNSKLSLQGYGPNVNFSLPQSRISVASKSSEGSYIPEDEVASIPKPTSLALSARREDYDDDDISYLQLQTEPQEALKSPFEEEPLYQFYQKHVSRQATMWHTISTYDDDRRSEIDKGHEEDSMPQNMHPTAMDLLDHSRAGLRTLWCEVPEVINSGIMNKISQQERKLQEAMFEVITSEASYLKSLNVLVEHFMKRPEFSDDFSCNCVLERRERHVLFSDVLPVRDVSIRLLADLEKRWQENIVISNICDILYEHATKFFSVYVRYCSNQVYQERKLKELKATRPDFVEVLQRLEANPICQGLCMHSFLMLPMQRITRLPLLVDAIFHRLSVDSSHYDICKLTLTQLNKVVWECNEGARKMERMEEMLLISRQLDFKDSKSIALISASRWLVKRGELTRLSFDVFAKRTFGRSGRCSKTPVYLFLFTDLLLVAKKKSEDNYAVLDYCPRNMVQVFTVEDSALPLPVKLPDTSKNLFQLTMLQNNEGKTVEMILSCPLESDRTRWMEAVTPPKSENPDEKIYEEWDCPQVQCIFSYTAQQPDELSLDESDVVNVFRKMSDGWYEGERLRDGVRGWFPASYAVEIISSHIRARNLRQRYRLLVLSHAYLEEQRKACQSQCAKSK